MNKPTILLAAVAAIATLGLTACGEAASSANTPAATAEATATAAPTTTAKPEPTTTTQAPTTTTQVCENGTSRGEYEDREVCNSNRWVDSPTQRPVVVDAAAAAAAAQALGVPSNANCTWPAALETATPVECSVVNGDRSEGIHTVVLHLDGTVTVAAVPYVETKAAVPTYVVTSIVDGDTVDLDNGERVRLVGIDTPEQGECGYAESSAALSAMLLGRTVTLETSDEDRDKYGRLLRYVIVDGVDVGGQMLVQGAARTRYNSTDGYGLHPREAEYAAMAQPRSCTPAPAPVAAPAPTPKAAPAPVAAPAPSAPFYKNCDAVRAAGAAPIHPGDAGFQSKFDRDSDGVGCE